jgi:hypothetical protein
MLAGLMLGLVPWVGLIGRLNGVHLPFSTGILLLVAFGVLVIIFRIFRGPREPRGTMGLLTTHFGRGIILAASVFLVAAMNPPRAVAVPAIFAINVGVWYLLLLRHRWGKEQHPRLDR